jgi:hypothetical protein
MKSPEQMAASIERFRLGFWQRAAIDRPPVGVVPARTWLPIGYLRDPFTATHVFPANVTPDRVRTDYEDALIGRSVTCDDWLPYSAPWRAVPWLEAICGCGVRYASGSLAPEPCAAGPEALADLALPANLAWDACLAQQTTGLMAGLPDDCFASPTILRGPSDILAGMRGLSNFYLDLYDAPQAVARAAERVNRVFMDVVDRHFAAVPPKLGGYGHIYGYWAPGPTNVLQEDALGMCSPRVYADIFAPLNAEAARRQGPYTLFHLHSTGMRHWRHVLELPGLAGLEITVEANGPALRDMVPMLREILERGRLMLFVDEHFAELPEVLAHIPHDGLYLIISDKFIAGDAEYNTWVAANWPRRAVKRMRAPEPIASAGA